MNNDPIVNVRYAVMSVVNRMRLDSSEYYDWLEQLAIEWLTQEVAGDAIPSMEEATLNVYTGARVWNMPSDYIRHAEVGYVYNGHFYTLTRRDDLSVTAEDNICETNQDVTTPSDSALGLDTWPIMYWGVNMLASPIYTVGGGRNIAYYRIDMTKRQITFSQEVGNVPNGKVHVRYLSSGKNVNGATLLNPVVASILRKYLEWQLCEYDQENGLYGQAKDKERLYIEDKYNKAVLLKPLTLAEIVDTLNSVPAFNLGR